MKVLKVGWWRGAAFKKPVVAQKALTMRIMSLVLSNEVLSVCFTDVNITTNANADIFSRAIRWMNNEALKGFYLWKHHNPPGVWLYTLLTPMHNLYDNIKLLKEKLKQFSIKFNSTNELWRLWILDINIASFTLPYTVNIKYYVTTTI